MQSRGFDQSGLARKIGVSQATINRIIQGKTANSRLLPRIATQLGVPLAWLIGMSDNIAEFPSPLANDDDTLRSDMVEVDSVDIAYGMGGSFIDEDSVSVEKLQFPKAWLSLVTTAPPEHLFVARGIGDSMGPTIQDSDVIFVDRSQRVPRMSDQIWAMMFGEVGMVKRLRPRPDGSVVIVSDNKDVADDRATDGDLHVIGRVVAIVKRV
jgi:phage repressor protein C with HTH and peptisase S24 domain